MSEQVQVYGYRWAVLAAFMAVNLTIQPLWISYAPVSQRPAGYYGVSEIAVGALAMSFMVAYVPLSLPASYLIDRRVCGSPPASAGCSPASRAWSAAWPAPTTCWSCSRRSRWPSPAVPPQRLDHGVRALVPALPAGDRGRPGDPGEPGRHRRGHGAHPGPGHLDVDRRRAAGVRRVRAGRRGAVRAGRPRPPAHRRRTSDPGRGPRADARRRSARPHGPALRSHRGVDGRTRRFAPTRASSTCRTWERSTWTARRRREFLQSRSSRTTSTGSTTARRSTRS